jgi:hypothetical protein
VEMAYLEEPFVDREEIFGLQVTMECIISFNLNFEEYYLV